MRYTILGKTGLKVSAATIGTWAMGGMGWGEVDKEECISAIRTMVDQGVNIIDTAPFYGYGNSELVVGEAIKDIRDKVILATKGALLWDEKGIPIKKADYQTIVKGCEESLKRLKTDYIDIFLIHWPDEVTPMSEIMRALEDLRSAGKIRHAGASNFSKQQIEQCNESGNFEVLQLPYSMVQRNAEPLLQWGHSIGLGTMSYGSLGAGILTGTIREMPKFRPDDMRLNFYSFYKEPQFSQIMKLIDRLEIIAGKYEVPVAQVTINWNVQSGFLDTILMGVRKEQEAKENCAAFNWELEQEDVNYITESISELLD
jgi:Predicted oxidoreductases (related to aryl-alcohol dehydrogenases)